MLISSRAIPQSERTNVRLSRLLFHRRQICRFDRKSPVMEEISSAKLKASVGRQSGGRTFYRLGEFEIPRRRWVWLPQSKSGVHSEVPAERSAGCTNPLSAVKSTN